MKVVFLKGSVKFSFVQQDVTRSYCLLKNFVWRQVNSLELPLQAYRKKFYQHC